MNLSKCSYALFLLLLASVYSISTSTSPSGHGVTHHHSNDHHQHFDHEDSSLSLSVDSSAHANYSRAASASATATASASAKLPKGQKVKALAPSQLGSYPPPPSLHPHRRVTRAATARTERLWDFAVIPYEIESNFSGDHRALFKQAMRHWENYTCIKFIERTHEHPNYIVFTERPCGCCSFVGKRGNGPQAISIGKNCDKFGIVVHELGHVVGFWHEHTRPDRDNHVQIVNKNIMSGQEYNFNKLSEDEVNSLGLRYDFDSIMHYARNTFSKSAYLDTILPNEDTNSKARPEIGQRLRLSKGDIAQTNLLYRCPTCGRTLQEPSGVLESPYYPHSSPPIDGESCEWRITATHGERIVLNLTDIDLPESPSCEMDYIEIRDGYWHKSPLLAKLCGSKQVPEAIISSGYRMLVTYKSTGTLLPKRSYRGFKATYEAQCGGEIFNEEGILQSPNYPEHYLANKECVWLITVPENYHVALKFQSFDTEDNRENCGYDYLEVRDGHGANAPIVGKFCGPRIPHDLRSTSNKMTVKFFSDSSVQKLGFSATFTKEFDECTDCGENVLPHASNTNVTVVTNVDEDECAVHNGGCQQICKNTIGSYQCSCHNGFILHENGHDCKEASCTYHITSYSGEIESPNWPESYPAKKDCAWLLTTTPGHRIALSFVEFEVEPHQECAYDHIAIYDGVTIDSPTLGRFCGSKVPHPLMSSVNRMYMTFKSDASVQRKGFKALHRTQCGGRLVASNVTVDHIYSHVKFSDSDYGMKQDCEWIIEAPLDGQRLRLRFISFETEHENNCAYDFVEVYDGENDSAEKIGRFCGNNLPPELLSSSEYLFIRFRTDDSINSKGFSAAYQAVDAREDEQLIRRDKVVPFFNRPKHLKPAAIHPLSSSPSSSPSSSSSSSSSNGHSPSGQSGFQPSPPNLHQQHQRQSTTNPATANSAVIYFDPRRSRQLGSHSQLQPQPQPTASTTQTQVMLANRQRTLPMSLGSTSRIGALIRQHRPPRHHRHHQHHQHQQHQPHQPHHQHLHQSHHQNQQHPSHHSHHHRHRQQANRIGLVF